jgi:class 3 adenylate cyclase
MRSALEGERKQVTVLFADVVGFSTLAGPLDSEGVHTLMDGCFEILTQQVHRYEGTINQFTATASWPCSVRRSHPKTMPYAPCTRRWASR